ncbi:hypothetical protein OSB04_027800 [Centaurea solstitialis]|uniref:Late embryogenesis abundant protein LEA-2 subgroup domain-containing protein n=1 Tax=Centaurea solstitialis TaxID=347529 RepID=A0AA38W8M1_9ASTR|nr:hypothetical protein OSB04_027800 [Centaurea solstitialis]
MRKTHFSDSENELFRFGKVGCGKGTRKRETSQEQDPESETRFPIRKTEFSDSEKESSPIRRMSNFRLGKFELIFQLSLQVLTGVAKNTFQMGGKCTAFVCFLITAIVVILTFFAIYITRDLPSIQLQEFSVPALNTTTGNLTATNNTIYINLRLKNRNPATGLHYDPIYLNISFVPKDPKNTSMIQLGEYRLGGFYQGNGKAKNVMGPLVTRGFPMANSGFFRVEFFGKVRYKLVGYRKRHDMKLAADVEVDEKTGKKVEAEDIRLVKSGANWYRKWSSITVVPFFDGSLEPTKTDRSDPIDYSISINWTIQSSSNDLSNYHYCINEGVLTANQLIQRIKDTLKAKKIIVGVIFLLSSKQMDTKPIINAWKTNGSRNWNGMLKNDKNTLFILNGGGGWSGGGSGCARRWWWSEAVVVAADYGVPEESKRNSQESRRNSPYKIVTCQRSGDARGVKGFSPLQKCTSAIRQLAYGSAADSSDEYLRMSEKTSRECLEYFCEGIIHLYKRKYLRKPTATDI